LSVAVFFVRVWGLRYREEMKLIVIVFVARVWDVQYMRNGY